MQPTCSRNAARSLPTLLVGLAPWLLLAGLGCTPRVIVEAPQEPIVINLNVKIDHEVRVKVERELEEEFRKNEDVF